MTSAQIRQSFLDFFREKKHSIVPSSSLMPDAPNLLFTNAGMNQFVPIFLGQQKPKWNPPRVADTQKCIRTGGKHNDLEDVGVDTYHHTFFEMLGNWSFGDYFKKEAIEWAWELIVERWKFPAQRLYATVYCPDSAREHWPMLQSWLFELAKADTVRTWGSTDYQDLFFGPDAPAAKLGLQENPDLEAAYWWIELFTHADWNPATHVLLGNRKDNFWMMGDTGPCGPCSELHVDLTPDGDTSGALVNKNDPRCIEIWNLVFIQFNANPDGTLTPLPQRHVDTGMGFERVTAIIQGTKGLTDFSGTVSNYETDVFHPIFDEVEKLSNRRYHHTIPRKSFEGHLVPETSEELQDVAFRVIADHIRTLSFAIADGIIPSNEGRGYVLRRILRRAVRYGRSLGFHEPFFFKLVDVVAKAMGDVFPEVRANQKQVKETIKREEESFNKTLDTGIQFFNEAVRLLESVSHGEGEFLAVMQSGKTRTRVGVVKRGQNSGAVKQLFGEFAFKLYDTYGFPLDLTELMARERGLTVDVAGFDKLMDQQRERGRKARKTETIRAEDSALGAYPKTQFVGYEEDVSPAEIIATRHESAGDFIVVNRSPLYAEMGGQVGDKGKFRLSNQSTEIVNTVNRDGVFFLRLAPGISASSLPTNQLGQLEVDVPRRRAIERHHTVTHLLHWALHQIVSKDATQKGSYVGPDKLTFDFSSAPLTPQQKQDVEKLVSEKITENARVSPAEISYAEAKKRKDIQQFFGEKYGDTVRVIQIGGDPERLNGYSMELCGGTHVKSTAEIGAFRIVKEEAIAAGTRRIEAVAGDAARIWAGEEARRQQERFEILARKKPDLAPPPVLTDTLQTNKMLEQIDVRAAHLEKLDADVRDWEKKSAKASEAELQSKAAKIANDLALSKVGQKICVAEIQDGEGKLLQAVADALKTKFDGPIVLAGVKDGRVALVAIIPKSLTSKIQANKIIQEIAPIVGGKGGGRPESAQGGGTDVKNLGKVLAEAHQLLVAAMIS